MVELISLYKIHTTYKSAETKDHFLEHSRMLLNSTHIFKVLSELPVLIIFPQKKQIPFKFLSIKSSVFSLMSVKEKQNMEFVVYY